MSPKRGIGSKVVKPLLFSQEWFCPGAFSIRVFHIFPPSHCLGYLYQAQTHLPDTLGLSEKIANFTSNTPIGFFYD